MNMTVLQLILGSVMLFGLAGLIIPILPGLTIIWLAALVYAFAAGLNWVSGILFGGITLLMLGGNVVDNLMMGSSARQTGASWLAVGVAIAAGLVGSVVWPPLGGLLFAMLGIFVVEIIRLKDWKQAFNSTRSLALGCGTSVFIRIGIGMVMILLWLVWVFFVH